MTEEEAKQKECGGPPAVAYQIWIGPEKGQSRAYDPLMCQGQACMMFRGDKDWCWCGLAGHRP